jgi:hypothetical protein
MHDNPLADVIVAFSKLEPDPDDHQGREIIARLLGMAWTPEIQRPPEKDSSSPVVPAADDRSAEPARPRSPVSEETQAPPLENAERPLPFRIRSSAPQERKRPSWLEQVEVFPKPEERTAATPLTEPLLQPDWIRGILSGALSVSRLDGAIDIPTLIERICRGNAVENLPRLRWATLARGVQVWIDRGEGMTPFVDDQKWLEHRIRHVAGSHAVEVIYFSSSPIRKAGKGSRLTWKPFRELPPPRTGTTIVALTDLGIPEARLRERQAQPEEWIEFSRHFQNLGCPVVAFVPYPKARWPEELLKHIVVIPWDRKTSASRIRGLVGKRLL